MMREAAPWSPKMISSGSRLMCMAMTSSLCSDNGAESSAVPIPANVRCGKVRNRLFPTRTSNRRFLRENVAYFSQELNVRGNFGRFGGFWLLQPIYGFHHEEEHRRHDQEVH